MYYKRNIIELMEKIKNKINNPDFINEHKPKNTSFIRNRRLSFNYIMSFILTLPKEGLTYELDKFFNINNNEEVTITKQAFSKARQLISEMAFYELYLLSTNVKIKNPNTYKEHRVYAIDGSDFQLPDTDETTSYFGAQSSGSGRPLPMAKVSHCIDVLNGASHNVVIGRNKVSERKQAMELLNKDFVDQKEKPIILFDRGYPSKDMFNYLNSKGYLFLMRSKNQFINCVNECNLGDTFVKYEHRGETHELRVIKFQLTPDLTEILVTNIFADNYTIEDFKELYFLRWGIECRYRDLKINLKVEKFSGVKPICILQEIYATFLVFNLASIIKNICDTSFESKKNTIKNNHTYQTNRNNLSKVLLDNLKEILLDSKNKLLDIISCIIEKCKKVRSQVRPNRTRERKRKHYRQKHTNNYR
ncbi:MAG: IS4 family transposase [Lachnospirales bacterium]